MTAYNYGSAVAFLPEVEIDTADAAQAVHAADLDGDSDLDILSASLDDDTVGWYRNDLSTSGAFVAQTPISTVSGSGPRSVYAKDLDGDTDLDVLAVFSGNHDVVWYENDSGSFVPHTIDSDAGNPRSVFAADLDGDTDQDVLVASFGGDKIYSYANDGSGVSDRAAASLRA